MTMDLSQRGIIFTKPTLSEPFGNATSFGGVRETISEHQIFISAQENELVRNILNDMWYNHTRWNDYKFGLVAKEGEYEVQLYNEGKNNDTFKTNAPSTIGNALNYTQTNFDSFTYKNNQGGIEVFTIGLILPTLDPVVFNHAVNQDGTLTPKSTINLPSENFSNVSPHRFNILDVKEVNQAKLILTSSHNGLEIIKIDEQNQFIDSTHIKGTGRSILTEGTGSLSILNNNQVIWAVGIQGSIEIGTLNPNTGEMQSLSTIADESAYVNNESKLSIVSLNANEQLITWSNAYPYEVHSKIYNIEQNTFESIIEINKYLAQAINVVDIGDGKVMYMWAPLIANTGYQVSIYDNNTRELSKPIPLPISVNYPYEVNAELINTNQVLIINTNETYNETSTPPTARNS